jgi:hypothetical protein
VFLAKESFDPLGDSRRNPLVVLRDLLCANATTRRNQMSVEHKAPDALHPPADKSEPLYAAFVQIRNTELAAHWTRYNIQFAVNFGLLVAVLSRSENSLVAHRIHCISIVGFMLTLVWFWCAVQGKKLVSGRWEKHLRIYENAVPRPEHRLFQRVADEESKKSWLLKNWQNLNLLSLALPSLAVGAWCLLFLSKKVGGP